MLMQYKVIFASAVEVTYAVVTRTWLRQHLDGAYLELAVSAFRVATIVVYWGLFQDLVRGRTHPVSSCPRRRSARGDSLSLRTAESPATPYRCNWLFALLNRHLHRVPLWGTTVYRTLDYRMHLHVTAARSHLHPQRLIAHGCRHSCTL